MVLTDVMRNKWEWKNKSSLGCVDGTSRGKYPELETEETPPLGSCQGNLDKGLSSRPVSTPIFSRPTHKLGSVCTSHSGM